MVGDLPVIGALSRSAAVSEAGDRPRHHRDAASRAAAAPGDTAQTPLDNTAPGERHRPVPARQGGRSPRLDAGMAVGQTHANVGHILDLP